MFGLCLAIALLLLPTSPAAIAGVATPSTLLVLLRSLRLLVIVLLPLAILRHADALRLCLVLPVRLLDLVFRRTIAFVAVWPVLVPLLSWMLG